jgi:hypothetical protein
MGKTRGVPVVLVKGTALGTANEDEGAARDLIRGRDEDLFR